MSPHARLLRRLGEFQLLPVRDGRDPIWGDSAAGENGHRRRWANVRHVGPQLPQLLESRRVRVVVVALRNQNQVTALRLFLQLRLAVDEPLVAPVDRWNAKIQLRHDRVAEDLQIAEFESKCVAF